MTPSARLAAAIEVLVQVEDRHRPVRLALKAWGEGARYAGSGDRAAVSGLALDVLRRRRSLAWRMADDSPRAAALAAVRFDWGWSAQQVAEAAAGQPHGPGPLTEAEAAALAEPRPLAEAPPAVRGDYPDWLDASLARAYGDARADEGAALSVRAPVDLRVNTLKTTVERALQDLEGMGARSSSVLRDALRMPAPEASRRAAPVESLPVFAKGWFEVQDLGSQLAAAAAGPINGRQLLDLCAGGGGKTLALAAAMGNSGQIHAYDVDPRRLSEVVTRGKRAGVRNLQILSPTRRDPLAGLDERMDVVFVDAPCTGSGTWRRHPDAKWRLQPGQLQQRVADQDQVLDQAARSTKPGGRIVYVTCSVLMEEDEDRVSAFRERHPGYAVLPALDAITESGLAAPGIEALAACQAPEGFLRLSPLSSQTDGFFIAVLQRAR